MIDPPEVLEALQQPAMLVLVLKGTLEIFGGCSVGRWCIDKETLEMGPCVAEFMHERGTGSHRSHDLTPR